MVKRIIWLDILGIIFLLLALYLILTIILGNSATPIEVTIMLFLGLASVLGSQLYKLNREVGELKITMKSSFEKAREDMNLIKRKLNI